MIDNYRRIAAARLVPVLLALGGAIACGDPAADGNLRTLAQAYKVDRALSVILPSQVPLSHIVLGAGEGGLKINDGVTISGYGWEQTIVDQRSALPLTEVVPGGVTHSVIGQSYSFGTTEVGAYARVPALWSEGDVFVRSYGEVQALRTNGAVSGQQGATWTCAPDSQPSNCSIPEAKLAWTTAAFHFPVSDWFQWQDTDLTVENPRSMTIDNSYGETWRNVTVRGGATLTLRHSEFAYFMRSLILESGATLVVDNSEGQVKLLIGDPEASISGVDPSSQLIWRGTARRTALTDSNFLVGYAGNGDVDIGGNVSGVLVAPRARLVINNSASNSYDGAFFGKAIEVHQRNLVQFLRFEDWKNDVPGDPQLRRTGVYPNTCSWEADNDIQGVAHDDSGNWYFSQAKDFATYNWRQSYIWRTPMTTPVGEEPSDRRYNTWGSRWDHFGDLTYHDGSLYVPVEPAHGTDNPAMIFQFSTSVFSDSSVQRLDGPIGSIPVPGDPTLYPDSDPSIFADCGTNNHASWLGYNPDDSLFYTSASNNAHCLNAYSVSADGEVTWRKSLRFHNWQGQRLAISGQITGGEFFQGPKPYGQHRKLYLAVQGEGGGVFVVDVTRDALIVATEPVPNTPAPDGEDELEGVDVWPLGYGQVHNIWGDVHVMKLENDITNDDDFSFYHFVALNYLEL